MIFAFVALADGLAMMLPGPSSAPGGAVLAVLGGAWLTFGFPRLLSPGGRPFSAILVSRFGLVVLPLLCLPVAGLWLVATPAALTPWFAVAWLSVWSLCVGLSASLPCPHCGLPFGRDGIQLQIRSSECRHCGADPRATPS